MPLCVTYTPQAATSAFLLTFLPLHQFSHSFYSLYFYFSFTILLCIAAWACLVLPCAIAFCSVPPGACEKHFSNGKTKRKSTHQQPPPRGVWRLFAFCPLPAKVEQTPARSGRGGSSAAARLFKTRVSGVAQKKTCAKGVLACRALPILSLILRFCYLVVPSFGTITTLLLLPGARACRLSAATVPPRAALRLFPISPLRAHFGFLVHQ